jgi:Zn-dependent membrane protease YugP
MVNAGIVTPDEVTGAGRVLNAAFLTYLASAIASILTLLYYLHRSGLLNRR